MSKGHIAVLCHGYVTYHQQGQVLCTGTRRSSRHRLVVFLNVYLPVIPFSRSFTHIWAPLANTTYLSEVMEYYAQAAGPSPQSCEPFCLEGHASELDVKWTKIVADPSNAQRVIDIYDVEPTRGSVNHRGDSYAVSLSHHVP